MDSEVQTPPRPTPAVGRDKCRSLASQKTAKGGRRISVPPDPGCGKGSGGITTDKRGREVLPIPGGERDRKVLARGPIIIKGRSGGSVLVRSPGDGGACPLTVCTLPLCPIMGNRKRCGRGCRDARAAHVCQHNSRGPQTAPRTMGRTLMPWYEKTVGPDGEAPPHTWSQHGTALGGGGGTAGSRRQRLSAIVAAGQGEQCRAIPHDREMRAVHVGRKRGGDGGKDQL